MIKPISRGLPALFMAFACGLLAFSRPLVAQAAPPAEVEVAGVKFNSVKGSVSANSWLEAEVELNVKPATVSGESRFLNRVKVSLSLGIEAGLGNARRVDFYRSEAEFVTLEYGRAFARFYLPPEIVRRDALRNDVKFYLVELAAAGKEVPVARTNLSVASLPNPEAMRSFQAKIASTAGVNEGVLLPQYLTSFAYDVAKPAPSPIRK